MKEDNQISIIINGVRYDAVDKNEFEDQTTVCDECVLCDIIPNFPCYSLIGHKVFKKSDKKFEI